MDHPSAAATIAGDSLPTAKYVGIMGRCIYPVDPISIGWYASIGIRYAGIGGLGGGVLAEAPEWWNMNARKWLE